MRTFNIRFTIVLLLCELLAVVWGDLPINNEERTIRATEEIIKRYPTGNPDTGLPNFSAFELQGLTISGSNPNKAIQINFEFVNCTAYGVEEAKFTKAVGFDKVLKNTTLDVFMPNFRLKGNYEMTGNLLLLPINGKGRGEVHLKETSVTSRIRLEKVVKPDNKTYLKITKIKSIVEVEQVIVHFENLFNGNPELSKTLNDVMNENWSVVWIELQNAVNQAMGETIQKILNAVFQSETFEKVHLD